MTVRASTLIRTCAPVAAPLLVASVYVSVGRSAWPTAALLGALTLLALSYRITGDSQRAWFLSACALALLPMAWGWHLVTPALGACLFLALRRARPSLQDLFITTRWRAPALAAIVVIIGVVIFAAARRSSTVTPGSFGWSDPPGAEWGRPVVLVVVLVASLVNATFEELLWRVGLADLFAGRRGIVLQWLLVSACFGLAHIAGTPGGIVGMAFAGLFGLAMCVVRALSGAAVVWCVGIHVMADIILIGEVYGAFV